MLAFLEQEFIKGTGKDQIQTFCVGTVTCLSWIESEFFSNETSVEFKSSFHFSEKKWERIKNF